MNGDCGNETEAMCLVDEDEAVNESSVMGNGGVLDSMDVDSVGGSVGKAVSDGCGSAQDSAQSPQKLKEEEQEEENMELGSGEDMFGTCLLWVGRCVGRWVGVWGGGG